MGSLFIKRKAIDISEEETNLYYLYFDEEKEEEIEKEQEKRKTSWIYLIALIVGFFFRLLFICIFILVLIDKLIEFKIKSDFILEYEDTIFYSEEIPSIKLNQDIFYGGFALQNPSTYEPFIDETIYYPKAYFKIGKRLRFRSGWGWKTKEVELEKCKMKNWENYFQINLILII